MRVLHLIKGLGRGGAETLLLQAQRQPPAERSLYSYGYFLPWKDALVEELRQAGAEVICFPARGAAGMLLRIPRLIRFARSWRAQLLHCHLPLAGVVGRIAGSLAGIPVVYTEHNLQERYHPFTRRANRLTWRLQRAVIAVSGEVAESIRRNLGDSVPVQVVLNGIPVERYRPDPAAAAEVRRRWQVPADAPLVGTVAVLRAQKALDDWLAAAATVRGAAPRAHFLIVGDGPLRSELEGRAAALGLADAVRFAGLQQDVRPFLSAFDVFLSTSVFEGLPLALLEAMAMERAVVATAVGGVAEAAVAGVSARLTPPHHPEESARATSELLSDEAERRRLGREARRRVEERFGMARMLREIEAVYQEVLAG